MPQYGWMNTLNPLCILEDALAFLKPAGTVSLCKPTYFTPTWLLQQPYLPLQMNSTVPLCVGTAQSKADSVVWGSTDTTAAGPADAELIQMAAVKDQLPGRS